MEDLQRHLGTLLDYLLQRGDVSPSTTRSEIYATNADERPSALLGIRLDQSLLHLVETYSTGEGQPIALSLHGFLTEHLYFHVNRRAVGRPRSSSTT